MRKVTLDVQEAIEKLIEYNYEKEAEDFLDWVEDTEHRTPFETHIFYFINRLNNRLNTTKTHPEDWAKELLE